jgi:hypothetical protein
MATAAFGKFIDENPGFGDTARNAMRAAAHIAHEGRAFKTGAVDAIEDRMADAKLRIRQQPFTFVGMAFAIGVPVGLALGVALGSFLRPTHRA